MLPPLFLFMTAFHDHSLTIVTVAFLFDAILGDPQWLYHPVRLVGLVIDWLEKLARKVRFLHLKLAGAISVVGLTSAVFILIKTIISFDVIGFVLAIWLGWSGLALKCLQDEGERVRGFLARGDMDGARTQLSYLVSRETSGMDETQIRRSLAETLSENFSDGFFAPFLYLVLFGPAGLWAYKTVNTFDSMWGYRTERFRDLGCCAARVDDVLNYVPARLSALLLMLTCGRFDMKLLSAIARDAKNMESPNAGWPMAACAHLVGATMGGPTVYHGVVKDKPILGIGGEWQDESLERLQAILRRAGWLALALAGLLLMFI